MVGQTGEFKAAVLACETVDACVRDVVNQAKASGYTCIILADHGNSETMINPDGSPNTAHTTNPVPLIIVDEEIKNIKSGILGDIARSEEHTSELQSRGHLVCRLLLEKKKEITTNT